ncbi:MAG: ATP-binding protein [Elusimicrobiota bacterium]|jgi:predicted ATPase|nr:ATP-binding protein [Elusimicrobiota bacterium]
MKKVVITGGPASGKTTILSILKDEYGTDIEAAMEAATLVYGGGFPRDDKSPRHTYRAQRIIYFVTKELEALAEETNPSARLIVCDRGSLDGAIYWPYGAEDFLKTMRTTVGEEYKKYYAVIHMSPPKEAKFYQNTAVRTESLERALQIDVDILKLWAGHPRHIVIPESNDYVKKALIVRKAIKKIINGEI